VTEVDGSSPAGPYPEIADAFKEGVRLHQAGRLDEAERIYRRVLEAQPDHFDSVHLLGVIDLQRGYHAEAIRKIDAALALNPALVEAYNNRGNTLLRMRRFDEALASYDKATALRPDYAEAFNNRGAAAQELNRLDEALASFDKAIALNPGYANAHNNRGNVLMELRRLDEAVASYDQAIGLKPDYAGAFYNRGTALRELKQLDEALLSYDQAIALKPDYADAFNSRGMLKLLLGRYRDGWADYEWRGKAKGKHTPPAIDAPEWQGEDLSGRRIATYSEMHFGDVIQFVRYLPLLSRRGADVTLLVPAKLIRLLQPFAPQVALVDSIDPRSSFDFKCALMSLPFRFGTEPSSLPRETRYLVAERPLALQWKDRIGEAWFKIGIAWQGTPQWTVDRRRFALTDIAPLSLLPHVRLVSLQKNHGLDQLENLPAGTKVETLGDFDDGPDAFIDTAAVMDCLDLIITSDTSIAHLAGALGRPTWVALKHVPDWRWLLDRDDSPWYPTMRLFRQATDGDWTSVFAKMEQELRVLLGAR
jgi:Tfp pilus assembly protein PilF